MTALRRITHRAGHRAAAHGGVLPCTPLTYHKGFASRGTTDAREAYLPSAFTVRMSQPTPARTHRPHLPQACAQFQRAAQGCARQWRAPAPLWGRGCPVRADCTAHDSLTHSHTLHESAACERARPPARARGVGLACARHHYSAGVRSVVLCSSADLSEAAWESPPCVQRSVRRPS